MSLGGKKVFVTGGSGTIGSGIVRQLLQLGALVIAPVRTEEGAQSLKKTVDEKDVDRLKVHIADISQLDHAKQLAKAVNKEHGMLDHVVSCVGSLCATGELSKQSIDDVYKQLGNLAIPHIVVYQAMLPLLKDEPESSFTFFTGRLGGHYMPGVSLTTVGAACLFGVSVAARGECKDRRLRVNEFRLGAYVRRDAEADMSLNVFSHFTVGKLVAELVLSDRKGEVVTVSADQLKAGSL